MILFTLQIVTGISLVAQWVKAAVWHQPQLQHRFSPWPTNFHMLWVQPKKNYGKVYIKFTFFFSFFFFLSCPCSIWKFPGQGLNPSHSHDLHHSCGNTRSSTLCTTVGTPTVTIFKCYCSGVSIVVQQRRIQLVSMRIWV